MKPRHVILPVCFTLAASSLHAADGSWTANSPGNWSDIANWNSGAGPIANGADFTATFGNVITDNRIVTLDSDRTIGNITASDTTHNYTISGANVLTLDVTTGKPIINVTTGSRTLTITSVIEGNDGLQKNGAGTLLLNAISNNFSGNIDINAGTLRVGDNNTAARLGGATYAGNILNNGTLWFTHNQNQELSGVISGSGILNKGGSGTLTLSGDNTYTGKTIIAGSGAGGPGLSVSSFNSVNESETGAVMASSSLGAPTTIANGTIQFGNSGNQRSSTLIYTGSGETTNRVMNVNSTPVPSTRSATPVMVSWSSPATSPSTPSSGNTAGGLTLRGSGDGKIAQIGTSREFWKKRMAALDDRRHERRQQHGCLRWRTPHQRHLQRHHDGRCEFRRDARRLGHGRRCDHRQQRRHSLPRQQRRSVHRRQLAGPRRHLQYLYGTRRHHAGHHLRQCDHQCCGRTDLRRQPERGESRSLRHGRCIVHLRPVRASTA